MDIPEKLERIHRAVSSMRAYRYVEAISGYNRVQMSKGFDDAADYCNSAMLSAGLESHIIQTPAPVGAHCLSQRGFDSWTCQRGILRLADSGEVLCDYEALPTSLIQRSCPVHVQGAEIVLLDRGVSESAYDDLDLAGKIVFPHDMPFSALAWAVEKRGALGIITDDIPANFTRCKSDLPDAHSFFTFNWLGDAGEKPCFGFVLSPRQGEALKRLCLSKEASFQTGATERYPRCDVEIVAATAPGSFRIVESVIQGATDEEILITGHLCHPKPSANDNASGCGAGMEAMRALHALIEQGKLPRPARTIKLVLVPEVSGTFAYLSTRESERSRIRAAINLDMVGRRQEGRSGLLGIWATPDATPSFIIDLMAYIRKLSNREAPSFNIKGYVTPFHSEIMEYNGGSDHYVYCDPTIHIPCITFMQWMDKNYHTSTDTIENIDPEMMHKSTTMAACWAYAMATLTREDLPPVLAMMRERFLAQLHAAAEQPPIPCESYAATVDYYVDVYGKACDDIMRFLNGKEITDLLEKQKSALRVLADADASALVLPAPESACTKHADLRIPRRRTIGPISFVGNTLGIAGAKELAEIKSRYPGLYGYNSVDNFILFWIDGKRTVAEIAKLVGFESRFYDPDYVREIIDYLAKHHIVGFV